MKKAKFKKKAYKKLFSLRELENVQIHRVDPPSTNPKFYGLNGITVKLTIEQILERYDLTDEQKTQLLTTKTCI